MMNQMMQETLTTGTARKAELPGFPAAGKTGTSQDFRDAWFVGYTGHLVTGVWLGNDDNSPTKKLTGGGMPVEIWSRFMKAAHQGLPMADLPGMAGRTYDPAPQRGAAGRAAARESAHLDAGAAARPGAVQPRGRHASAGAGRAAASAGRDCAAVAARHRSGARRAAASAAGRGCAAARRRAPPPPTPRAAPRSRARA